LWKFAVGYLKYQEMAGDILLSYTMRLMGPEICFRQINLNCTTTKIKLVCFP